MFLAPVHRREDGLAGHAVDVGLQYAANAALYRAVKSHSVDLTEAV